MSVAEKKRVLAEYNARQPDCPGNQVRGPYHDPRSEVPYFVVLGAADTAAAYYPDGNPNQAVDDRLAEIARRVLRLDTLLPRGRDALDFRSLGVLGVRDALQEAYEVGRADGVVEGAADEQPDSSVRPVDAGSVPDAIVMVEAEAAFWHRKRNGRYDPDGLDHDQLMDLLRRVAGRAFVAGRAVPPCEVVVTVDGGVVGDVEGLPPGWTWRLEDGDVE